MAYDYTALAATANTLIAQFGRSLTLLKTPRTANDSAEPWKGPAAWDDSTAPAGHKLTGILGVFVGVGESEYQDVSGGLIRRGANGFLVAASGLPSGTVLTDFDAIDDSGNLWKINKVTELKPGATALLYGVEVSQ
jgi:hypothetical protein